MGGPHRTGGTAETDDDDWGLHARVVQTDDDGISNSLLPAAKNKDDDKETPWTVPWLPEKLLYQELPYQDLPLASFC